jgi:hypothetical protein
MKTQSWDMLGAIVRRKYTTHAPSEWIQLRAKFFAMLKSSCVQKQVVNDKRILSKTEVYVLARFNIYNSQYYQI